MKECPKCNRSYSDDTLVFCLDDGTGLVNARDFAATQKVPPPRATNPPPTLAMPYTLPQTQPQQRSGSPWLVYGLVCVLAFFVLIGGVVVAWLSLRDKNGSTPTPSPTPAVQSQSATTNSNTNKKDGDKSQSSENGSPSQKLVGVWRANVNELGATTTITYTFSSDGSSKAAFTDSQGETATDYGTWRYSDGILYEKFSDGASGKGSIEWIDDDTFEITIIDNGIPAYTGLKRRYSRVS